MYFLIGSNQGVKVFIRLIIHLIQEKRSSRLQRSGVWVELGQ